MAQFSALPLFTDALIADTGHLSDEEMGRYMRLLILMWRSPGCRIPDDHTWIAKRLRIEPLQYGRLVAPLIAEFCTCYADAMQAGWIMQKRLTKEHEHVAASVAKRKAAAAKRWDVENKGKKVVQSINNADAPTPTPTPNRRIEGKPSIPIGGPVVEMAFARVWEAYPGRGKNGESGYAWKGDRKTALRAFRSIVNNVKESDLEKFTDSIVAGAGQYQEHLVRSGDRSKHCSTWLNADGWRSDYSSTAAAPGSPDAKRHQPAYSDTVVAAAEQAGAQLRDAPGRGRFSAEDHLARLDGSGAAPGRALPPADHAGGHD